MTKISGISTTATTVASADIFENEASGGTSQKITGANLAKALKTLAFSAALVKKSVDQTAANYSAFPVVTWDAEEYDTDAYHSTVSNTSRLTVPAAGYYVVMAQVSVGSTTLSASDYIRLAVTRYNSSSVAQSAIGLPGPLAEISATNTAVKVVGTSMPISCASGDYFEVNFDTESDTSITIEAAQSWFGIWRIA